MNAVAWLGLGVFALFAASAWLAIWSRRDTWGRPAAVILFLLGMPAIVAAGIEALGHHRPLWTAWDVERGDLRVLAVKLVQDTAIYLYLDDPGRLEPRALVLPWDNETANRIQKLQDEARPEAKGQFVMRHEPSLDIHGPQFHPLPQPPALPPKNPPEPALHFDQGV
jgi:hypothetical protein